MKSNATPYFIGFVFLAISTAAFGQLDDAARLLDEGNAYYREGDFEKARLTYERIPKTGVESGVLYHNLGNAYFRLDHLGNAMLNYQRALRLLPGDPEVDHNIRLLQTRSKDRFSQVPEPVLARWWNGFIDSAGIRPTFWLGAIAWLGGIALASYRTWNGGAGPWLRRGMLILVTAGMFLTGSALATSFVRSTVARGVVVADRAEVREEPSSDARSQVAVHEALVVVVLDRTDGWARIRLPNGVAGFVRSETVETV